jgi:hypothetical protein
MSNLTRLCLAISFLLSVTVSAVPRAIDPRLSIHELRSDEARIIAIGADNSSIAVSKVKAIGGAAEFITPEWNGPFAVMLTRSGDVFTRVVGVSGDLSGQFALLLPYNEAWNVTRVIVLGLKSDSGSERIVTLSAEQLAPSLPQGAQRLQGGKGAIPLMRGSTTCFIVGSGSNSCFVCYDCDTYFGVEVCSEAYFPGFCRGF